MTRFPFYLLIMALLMQACANEATNNAPNAEETDEKEEMVILVKTEKDSLGTLLSEYEYDTISGVKHGFYRVYHPSGNVYREMAYQYNKMHGIEKLYYEDGKLQAEFKLVEGMYDGPFMEYYPDGSLKQEGTYEKDKYQGELKTYYPNGQLKEVVNLVDNLEQGPFVEYNENGTLKAKGNYMSKGANFTALEDGLLELYDEEGTLITKRICKEGQCCKFWTAEDGEVEPSSEVCASIIKKYKEKQPTE